MNYRKNLQILISGLLLGASAFALEADDAATDEKQKEKLQVEYQQALEEVESQKQAADASMVKAKEQLKMASEQKSRAEAQSTAQRAAKDAEFAAMHEELNRARQQLSQTSREIARVNREISRERSRDQSSSYSYRTSNTPVIGVILGDDTDVGVEILGVSPDGPSERAGMKQGDVIIALGGRVLTAVDDTGNLSTSLRIAMKEIEASEPVIISVERGTEIIDLTVVPEVREPLTWHSVTRFPSAPVSPTSPTSPDSPHQVMRVERLVVPEIDTVELTAQIDRMRADIDTRRVLIESHSSNGDVEDFEYEFEFHEMSEIGENALHETNVWFGMPMASGLKLATVDASLGEYFKTDRGVLVLSAKNDNNLQLQSGDVVLQVGKTEVNSPAEFMRALREFESGQELILDIKRDRKNKTLKSTMPESRTSFIAPAVDTNRRVLITKSAR
jgi:S1-C subfamily serine protease